MKRLLSLVLVLVLALTTFVGCDAAGTVGGVKDKVTGAFGNVKDSVTGAFDTVKDKVTGAVDGIKDKINSLLGKEPEKNEDLEAAAKYVFDLYKDTTITTASFDVVKSVLIGDVKFGVTWTADVESITITDSADDENAYTVNLPVKPAEEIKYVLTATITDAATGEFLTKEFRMTLPKYEAAGWQAFYEAEDGDPVFVKGVVTGISSASKDATKNNVYLEDKDGGYLVFQLDKDPIADLGIQVGMTVEASGVKAIYYGVHEIKEATVEIVDETLTPVTPADFTEIALSVKTPKDEKLTGAHNRLVTIKGVELTGQSAQNDSYYMFKIGNIETYIRISGSECMLNKADQKTFKDTYAAAVGSKADITGIISIYSGAFYLIPVDNNVIQNVTAIERSDAEKAAYEADRLTVKNEILANTTIDLPSAGSVYTNAAITWESDNACAVVADGKLTITLQKDAQTVKLTATVTVGTESTTKEFTLNVAKAPTIVPQVVTAPVAGTAYKLFYNHVGLGNLPYYFNGQTNSAGYYGAVSNVLADAVDVFVENAEGGFYMYFLNADNKKVYIETFISGTHCNIRLTENTPESVYTMDAEYSLPVVTLDGTKYFLGTYETNQDIRPSKYDQYITSATNCHLQFCVMVDLDTIPAADKVAAEKAGVSVVDTVKKATEIELPLVGTVYTDVAIAWASNNALAVVEGGKVTFTLPEGQDVVVTLTATLTCGDVTETLTFDVTLVAPPAVNYVPEAVTAPVAGTAYKFFLFQGTLDTNLYLNGEVSGRYLVSVEDYNAAVDFYIENAEGGFYIYFEKDGAKNYIEAYLNSSDKTSLRYSATPSLFTMDETYGMPVTNFNDKTYFIGTYNDFKTLNLSEYKYASQGNFLGKFATMVVETPATNADKVAQTKTELAVTETVTKAGDVALAVAGTKYTDVTVTWTSDNALAVVGEGKVTFTIPEDADATVTLTATVTCGDVTETVTFTVTVKAPTNASVDVDKDPDNNGDTSFVEVATN